MIRQAIKKITEAVVSGATHFKKYEVMAGGMDFEAIIIGEYNDEPIMLITSDETSMKAEIEINWETSNTEFDVVDDVAVNCKKLFGFKLNTKDKVYQRFMRDNYGFVPESFSANEAKMSKPQLLKDMETWLKASGFDFEVKDNKTFRAIKGAKPEGQTELVFKSVDIAKSAMAKLAAAKKFDGVETAWGGFVLGFVWNRAKNESLFRKIAEL